MPKCKNDETKSYTGKELSPKGLGYSASGEEVGKVMKGKDKEYYIVKATVKSKKWTKVNYSLDNLPTTCFNKYWKPNIKKIEQESGLEEKFGGTVPFFIKGETWPVDENNLPMVFFCQFKDPRKNNNILYRVFFPIDDDLEYEFENKNWINTIELNDKNLKNKVIIEKPKGDNLTTFDPWEIINWTQCKEFKSLYKIKEILKIPNEVDLIDKYYYHEYTPDSSIKVGGTPVSTQYEDSVESYDLIQLTHTTFLPYMWGDAGIAHINDNCAMRWDCC
jgi:uncharacterized protein YwqG